MNFEYCAPARVIFGDGCLNRIKDVVEGFSVRKVMLVTGKHSMKKLGVTDKVIDILDSFDVNLFDKVEPEPSTQTVDSGVKVAKNTELVIGLGGGSALDVAKAVAVISTNEGSASEYQQGKELKKEGLPVVAIPTTSGTGSEVTRISVLTNLENNVKRSFRDDLMYPKVALDDPELTVSMPPHVTASSGMDALTHAIEGYVSTGGNPITDALHLKAIGLISNNLLDAFHDGKDINARRNMMLGNMMAGLGFTNSGCGLAHGLGNPLGGVVKVSHGVLCSLLLPYVIEFNMKECSEKYGDVAMAMGLKKPEEVPELVRQVSKEMSLPSRLSEVGFSKDSIPKIAKESLGGSTLSNPRKCTVEDIIQFLNEVY